MKIKLQNKKTSNQDELFGDSKYNLEYLSNLTESDSQILDNFKDAYTESLEQELYQLH